jgi:RNA ligase (TIGR02306 family)
MATNRKAPFKHNDGTNCWTKNCSRGHTKTSIPLVAEQIKKEIEEKKANLMKNQSTQKDVRKLVSIRTINAITPIPDADAIEAAHIGGWPVVVKKGDFKVGDKAVYLEIDSLLPENQPAFADFQRHGSRTMELEDGTEVKGYVIKSIKLRGQLSQGLILPISMFPELNENSTQEEVNAVILGKYGVVKYEAPIPASLSGKVRGQFPTRYIQKTDSERVQNLSDEFLQSPKVRSLNWVATEKLDGTSATFMKIDGELRVCSRNLELVYDPNDNENAYNRIANELNLAETLPEGGIIQGEIYGEGIQKNPLKVRGVGLRVFNAKNIVAGSPVDKFLEPLRVPKLDIQFPKTIEEAVTQADGLMSTLNPTQRAEGIVWWNTEGVEFPETGGRANFKAINNQFLLKAKD